MRAAALCAAALLAAPATSERASEAKRDAARGVLEVHGCGKCHDSKVSTAKAEALAVFDLQDEDWSRRMTSDQLPKLLGRLRSAPKADREIVRRFIEAERAKR